MANIFRPPVVYRRNPQQPQNYDTCAQDLLCTTLQPFIQRSLDFPNPRTRGYPTELRTFLGQSLQGPLAPFIQRVLEYPNPGTGTYPVELRTWTSNGLQASLQPFIPGYVDFPNPGTLARTTDGIDWQNPIPFYPPEQEGVGGSVGEGNVNLYARVKRRFERFPTDEQKIRDDKDIQDIVTMLVKSGIIQ